MGSNPEKYSALVYHNNDNQSSISSTYRDSNLLDVKINRQIILSLPPYDDHVMEDYKVIVLEEAEKLYKILVDQIVCEVTNEVLVNNQLEHYLSYH
jgi:hypothetical protein